MLKINGTKVAKSEKQGHIVIEQNGKHIILTFEEFAKISEYVNN